MKGLVQLIWKLSGFTENFLFIRSLWETRAFLFLSKSLKMKNTSSRFLYLPLLSLLLRLANFSRERYLFLFLRLLRSLESSDSEGDREYLSLPILWNSKVYSFYYIRVLIKNFQFFHRFSFNFLLKKYIRFKMSKFY